MPNASTNSAVEQQYRHAALWLIGPDMPGLLNLGATWVAERGGNIDKDIADKFGEKAVVFMSITASPDGIKRMEQDKDALRDMSGCGVVFQAMNEPTVPEGFREELYGFDVVMDDAVGLIAELTNLVGEFGMMIVGHTGERRATARPKRAVQAGLMPATQAGQKFVVMLPHEFDHALFGYQLLKVVKKYHGFVASPLQQVPGLLWWWEPM